MRIPYENPFFHAWDAVKDFAWKSFHAWEVVKDFMWIPYGKDFMRIPHIKVFTHSGNIDISPFHSAWKSLSL